MRFVDNNGRTVSQSANQVESVPIEDSSQRVPPRQIGTGTQRGYQAVGSQNVVIDNPNQRIVINENISNTNNVRARVYIGLISGTDFGIVVTKTGNDVADVISS